MPTTIHLVKMFKKYVRYKGKLQYVKHRGQIYSYRQIYYVEVLWDSNIPKNLLK